MVVKNLRYFACVAVAAVVLGFSAGAGSSQDAPPGLDEGVRLIENGELDKAVVHLDRVVQLLRSHPAEKAQLASAQLHLASAYLGLEQVAKARTALLDAYLADPKVLPDVGGFAPRVLALYEEVRTAAIEAHLSPQVATAHGAAAAPAAELARRKGKGKGLIVGGLLAGVGGVAAIAAGGGGGNSSTASLPAVNTGSSGTPTPTPRPSATPVPTPTPTNLETQRFTCQADGVVKDVYLNEIPPGRTGYFRASVNFDQAGRGPVRVAIADRYGPGVHASTEADGGFVGIDSPNLTAGLYVLRVQSVAPVNRLCQAAWQLFFR